MAATSTSATTGFECVGLDGGAIGACLARREAAGGEGTGRGGKS